MEEVGMGLLAALGIGLIAVGIISIIFSLITIAGAIILLCLSIKEKGELKAKGIDEARIKKIVNLSIWSLVIMIVSCFGGAFLVLPILALIFSNSNAKTAFKTGNIIEAVKKSDTALLFLIISNAVILGLVAINTFASIISAIFN